MDAVLEQWTYWNGCYVSDRNYQAFIFRTRMCRRMMAVLASIVCITLFTKESCQNSWVKFRHVEDSKLTCWLLFSRVVADMLNMQ